MNTVSCTCGETEAAASSLTDEWEHAVTCAINIDIEKGARANDEYWAPHIKEVMVPIKVHYHPATSHIYKMEIPSNDDLEQLAKKSL